MNNYELYEYCKNKREKNGETWPDILKGLIKLKIVSKESTVEDIKSIFMDVAAKIAAGDTINEDGSAYDEAYEQFIKFIGKSKNYFELKESAKCNNNNEKDIILCVSDLHFPYTDYEKLYAVIENWKNIANILVINGDFLNGDRLSSHAKFKHESFKDEVAKGRLFLEYVSTLFEKVYLLDDNHVDARWKRFLGNEVPPDMHFLIEHPYDYICKGLENVIRAGTTHKQYGEDIGHTLIIGDCLFSHGFVSGKDGKSARKVQNWYNTWRDILNLPDIRLIVHGHVHQLSLNFDYDRAVIQAGTFASMEGLKYSLEGQLTSSPPCYGYSVIVQYNGKTDFSETNIYKL